MASGVSVATSGLRDKVSQWGRQVVEVAVRNMADEVHETVPVGQDDPLGRRQGGELRDSRWGPEESSPYRWRFGYTAEHGKFVDQGTAPHWIEAKVAGYPLVFWWDVTRSVMYLPEVFHPGYQPSFHWWSDLVNEERWYWHLEHARLEVYLG